MPDISSPEPLDMHWESSSKCDLELLSYPEKTIPTWYLVELCLKFPAAV
ncbi:hypothetical protein AARI_pII00040 (plasmid) [Glutamicibacter arilaitensis Re117]|uniref:Uncharacterized protein n=1 Tax=Glutamicibacter arilaitensis (strain DSM 16368 / CIP 108037 / IAM 15318 / JCM 13566 / NCIMB 14258 / Re117) TaxID=861360 RepID=A0ABM9PSS8_GLUAR|nr:hypothetical protein AARI_pII00040 [Glutamicibacter arilaitensis Re117]